MVPSLRQVLVHLDATRSAVHRMAAARQFAQQHGAALCALYAAAPGFTELPYAPEIGPSLAADLVAVDAERRDSARQVFAQALRDSPGLEACWGQTDEVPVAAAFARQAFYADLLVLGQHDATDASAAAVPADFVPSVLAACGRPALVIPYVGWTGTIGSAVALAWKETPEAARAVAAALPLLQRAAAVHVLAWGEHSAARDAGQPLDLEGYLHRHGVAQVHWHRAPPAGAEVGELLLSRAFDLDCDLLVMGCYGHGRAREWVLGGVSRTVLRSMTLPVLMMH